MPTAPYGSWRSPITADLIVSSTVGVGMPQLASDTTYWIESRPTEAGRNVIVRRSPDGTTEDINPAPMNARTRVHEYGGGDYTVDNDTVYWVNFTDQQIYVSTPGAAPVQLTGTPPANEPSDAGSRAQKQTAPSSSSSPSPRKEKGPGDEVSPSPYRYADLTLDPHRNRLIAVREDHTNPDPANVVNTIVAIPLPASGSPSGSPSPSTGRGLGGGVPLHEGHDFYSNPRLSPDGAQLAWLAWDHPQMPWDGTYLYLAGLDTNGHPTNPTIIAGAKDESITQPEWSPDNTLYYISDCTGHWNLHRHTFDSPSPQAGRGPGEGVSPLDAEFAKPAWVFGMSSYAIIDPTTILATSGTKGTYQLALIDTPTGAIKDLDTPYTDFNYIRANTHRAVFLAGSPTQRNALIQLDLTELVSLSPSTVSPESGTPSPQAGRGLGGGVPPHLTILKTTSNTTLDPRYISTPRTLEFPTRLPAIDEPWSWHGDTPTTAGEPTTAYAFYYPPHNADYDDLRDSQDSGPASLRSPLSEIGEGARGRGLPPLLVMSHGGPTSATSPTLSPRIQYWTSRGIAVLDVNYGGSTGYGRDYRRRLNKRWGIVDVLDCANAARYLVDQGLVDPDRIAITGGSAGGFTTLACLAFTGVFRAGASHYGVADLEALAQDTHKFELRYLDNLIGPYPGPAPAADEAPLTDPVAEAFQPRRPDATDTSSSPTSSEATPEAGAVGAQPPRGESEGSPLSAPVFNGVGGGAAQSDAQPGSPSGTAAVPTREALLKPYRDRSPIHHVDGLNCPVIFFQGLEDQIVPPNQAEAMVAALEAKGVPTTYIPFEGEQHGFRRAENIKRSLEEELLFYGRIFNFEAQP